MGKEFLCSDNWWIENNEVWFVDENRNLLFYLNLCTNKCKFLAEVPTDSNDTYRRNPICIKCEDKIYCMPDTSNSIWIYHLNNNYFSKIEINNPKNVRLGMYWCWKKQNELYVISRGLNQLFIINICKDKVEKIYKLEGSIDKSIKVKNCIYYVSSKTYSVFSFDIESKKNKEYRNSEFTRGINKICYDGINFWLSGNNKEIYIWNEVTNSVKVLNNFPKSFGYYNYEFIDGELVDYKTQKFNNSIFLDIVPTEQYIWFIPYQTNQILYVDKGTYKINALEIDDEKETKDTLAKNAMKHKYLIECVSKDNYIFLYSTKNQCILEINSDRTVKRKKFSFNAESLIQIGKLCMNKKKILFENVGIDKFIYAEQIAKSKKMQENKEKKDNGKIIYSSI